MAIRSPNRRLARYSGIVAAVVTALITLLTAATAAPASAAPKSQASQPSKVTAPPAELLDIQPPASLGHCVTTHTPVVLPDGSKAQIAGQMCTPRGARPATVQVTVHGATCDSDYWNWPQQPTAYNYVWKALAAGYAVYDVDRLGAGESTRPSSTEVTETSTVSTLHQVVTKLRAGRISGTSYRYVEGVGHSFGSYYLTAEAAEDSHDYDALVLTGAGDETSSAIASIPRVAASTVLPWASSLDSGYTTTGTLANRIKLLYYPPDASPAVMRYDNTYARDTASNSEFTTRPADLTSLSMKITVPVLLLVGNHDNHYTLCDGATCTTGQSFYDAERSHFGTSCLSATVVPSGHDVQLSISAPEADRLMLDWSKQALGPHAQGPTTCPATGAYSG
jgi:pimeloyl-ACP methyl ester carboxylesterase